MVLLRIFLVALIGVNTYILLDAWNFLSFFAMIFFIFVFALTYWGEEEF